MVRDYRHANGNGAAPGAGAATKQQPFKGPDQVVHHPPAILFGIGGFGFAAGVFSNCWQLFTTFVALWVMFNAGTSNYTLNPTAFWQKQPVIAWACLLIASCAQYFLQMLVFKINEQWKAERAEGKPSGNAMWSAAVHMSQQVGVLLILSGMAVLLCTVSDFTFIGMYTSNPFLIFAYTAALYAFSTIGFVRSIDYLWAAMQAIYGKGGKTHA